MPLRSPGFFWFLAVRLADLAAELFLESFAVESEFVSLDSPASFSFGVSASKQLSLFPCLFEASFRIARFPPSFVNSELNSRIERFIY